MNNQGLAIKETQETELFKVCGVFFVFALVFGCLFVFLKQQNEDEEGLVQRDPKRAF